MNKFNDPIEQLLKGHGRLQSFVGGLLGGGAVVAGILLLRHWFG